MSSSTKSSLLRGYTANIGRNMSMFKEGTELLVRDHQKSNVKHSSFAIHLAQMSTNEPAAPLRTALSTLSRSIDLVEVERLKVLGQLQALVVNKFAKYEGDLKVLQHSIDARNKPVTQFARVQSEMASARASGNQQRIAVAQGTFDVSHQHMRGAEDVLNKGMGDFELKRVAEMKEALTRLVRNQIYFHAKSIEALTVAYQEIVKVDPKTEMANFIQHLREAEWKEPHAGAAQHQPQQQQEFQQAMQQRQQQQQQQQNVAAGGQFQQQQQPLQSPGAQSPQAAR